MKRLNITPGKAFVGTADIGEASTLKIKKPIVAVLIDDIKQAAAALCGRPGTEQPEANAILYADAHNTYHATGMLPSEMAERIKALEDGLRQAKAQMSEAESLLANGTKYEALHVSGTLQQGIVEIEALLNPINDAHAHLITKPE